MNAYVHQSILVAAIISLGVLLRSAPGWMREILQRPEEFNDSPISFVQSVAEFVTP